MYVERRHQQSNAAKMSSNGARTAEIGWHHRYARRDDSCVNGRGQAVRYSAWRRVRAAARKGDGEKRPTRTLVYLHGNASSRVEALGSLSLALTLGFDVLAPDCAGSGVSDGAHVSLGWHERDDVVALLARERSLGRDLGAVALWGRSMGAATAVLYCRRADMSPTNRGRDVDSPWRWVAATPRPPRGYSVETGRSGRRVDIPWRRVAAAAAWIFRGDGSRRRRGRRVETPRRRVAAAPRPPRG